ncbi:hypothetical protein [Streptomyces sp. V17-9]|uniref:hypothetical protein n=1 Tax=Streptomyces sp. V17-9 TaxID=2831149 RepID=UPI0020163C35|nr:hypothetical protein [Streptomyces sp. V17-9]
MGTSRRDVVKYAVLREDFDVVADEQARGRRVTVYERRAPGPSRDRAARAE